MKKHSAHKICLPLLTVLVLLFNSCIGLSIDIQMNRDGSGRLAMEYRISRMLDSLGALDGNENMPAIPISRQDWERTIERIGGLRLISYSSNQRGQDTVIAVTVNYDNPRALSAILAPGGTRTIISLGSRNGQFNIILNAVDPSRYLDSSQYDENLLYLMRTMFTGYSFSLSFSAAETSSLTITNGAGTIISPPSSAQIVPSGKKVSMSIGMMDLISLPDGLGASINW